MRKRRRYDVFDIQADLEKEIAQKHGCDVVMEKNIKNENKFKDITSELIRTP